MKQVVTAALMALFCGVLAHAGSPVIQTTTQSLSLTLSSAAKVSVPANLPLTTVGTTFQSFTGSQLVNYKARTTQAGSATLTLRGSSEFAPSTGPKIANGDMTYTCGSPGLGTGCSGSQTISTGSQTPVISVGSSTCVGTGCASSDPATITLGFVLTNNPQFQTGSYSAQLQSTCSAI